MPCGLVSFLIHHYTRKYIPSNYHFWAYTVTTLIYPTVFCLTYFLEKIPIWLFMHEETNDFQIVSGKEKMMISFIFILIGLLFQIYFVLTEQAEAGIRLRDKNLKKEF